MRACLHQSLRVRTRKRKGGAAAAASVIVVVADAAAAATHGPSRPPTIRLLTLVCVCCPSIINDDDNGIDDDREGRIPSLSLALSQREGYRVADTSKDENQEDNDNLLRSSNNKEDREREYRVDTIPCI